MLYENTLAGLTGIVTGAGSGIGREVALLAAGRGAQVIAVDVNPASLAETAAAGGAAIRPVACDISDPAATSAAIDPLAADGLDFLVNGAGIEDSGDALVDMPVEHWDRLMGINLRGSFLLMKAVLPGMRKRRSGSIVNMGSVAALAGWAELGAYTASKHAVVGLTRSAVAENAAYGIRINVICPGPIATPLQDRAEAAAPDPAEFRRRQEAAIPQGRYGEPVEVAQAIAFLISDQSQYLNGAVISIDGGMTATG